MHKLRRRAALFAFAFMLLFSVANRGAEVTVFAAASLSDALQDISRSYQEASGDRILFNFGGSSTLARQILEGARADLFFSADEEKMDQLEKKELIQKGSRRSILSNALVIVAPDSSLKSPAELRKTKRIAIAEPDSVPAGIYARKYLERVGLWAELKDRMVPTENVSAALAAVESGNADAAIVYKTDAAMSKKVKIAYEVPLSDAPKISYPLALLADARAPRAAQDFWTHVQTPAAAKVFKKFGFIVLPVSTESHGRG